MSISQDRLTLRLQSGFSLEITRDEWPCVFEKSSNPALIISTLEALAVLVALIVYYGEEPRRNRSSIRIVPTDNRGNGAALNKLMTTRYPASAVLMELAYSKKMGLRASVEWSPREANREADALENGELSLRIPVRFSSRRSLKGERQRKHIDRSRLRASQRGIGKEDADDRRRGRKQWIRGDYECWLRVLHRHIVRFGSHVRLLLLRLCRTPIFCSPCIAYHFRYLVRLAVENLVFS